MRNSVIKKNRKVYIFKHQQTSSGGGGGGADLENNKQVSITENGTVEITPSTGKDGMKKVTANVNVSGGGGVSKLYSWFNVDESKGCYTTTETPSVGDIVLYGADRGPTISVGTVYSVTEEGIKISEDSPVLPRDDSQYDINLV